MTESDGEKPGNYLSIGALLVLIATHKSLTVFSIDGGDSGLPALYIGEEAFSRLQYDIGSEDEIRPCDHCDLFIGSGPGAYVLQLGTRMAYDYISLEWTRYYLGDSGSNHPKPLRHIESLNLRCRSDQPKTMRNASATARHSKQHSVGSYLLPASKPTLQ
jgi:hypothetical protein